MIECKDGSLKMVGELSEIQADISLIINKLRGGLEEATGDPEFARTEILKCVKVGLMSDEEIKEKIKERGGKEND